jgi:hypothetical protein
MATTFHVRLRNQLSTYFELAAMWISTLSFNLFAYKGKFLPVLN